MKTFYQSISIILSSVIVGCTTMPSATQQIQSLPPLFPDYINVTMPCNIAPLRFALADSCKVDDAWVIFLAGNDSVVVRYSDEQFAISEQTWHRLVSKNEELKVQIRIVQNGVCADYLPFNISISSDSIDSYLSYRLIEPGYEVWNEMGLYQRNVESFSEKTIITNKQLDYGCVNCHSFCRNNSETMLFHARANYGATYLIQNKQIEKLNTKTAQTISSLVYPYWHPSGQYVAFSTNTTKQLFHTSDHNRIEVFDSKSDIVILDTRNKTIFSSPNLNSAKAFETFPTFTPDGKRLIFCSADSVQMPQDYLNVKYSVCSVSFDAANGMIGTIVDTLYNAKVDGASASFPRVSPNGRWLMFTRATYGNFSIWHSDADLCLIDLIDTTKTYRNLAAINSSEADSYHSWSSNGKWVVFSSRRIDGLYTRLFITHIDDEGNFTKPFLLPQADARYYNRLMKSFNIPEFTTNEMNVSGYEISKVAKESSGVQLLFNENKK